MSSFSQRLNEQLRESSKSQIEICKELGISKQKLSNWKTGYAAPNYDDLVMISNYFDVTTDYFLGRTNDFGQTITPTPSLTVQEKRLLDNFHKMRPDIKAYFVTMSETFAQTPDAIIERDNKKA